MGCGTFAASVPGSLRVALYGCSLRSVKYLRCTPTAPMLNYYLGPTCLHLPLASNSPMSWDRAKPALACLHRMNSVRPTAGYGIAPAADPENPERAGQQQLF